MTSRAEFDSWFNENWPDIGAGLERAVAWEAWKASPKTGNKITFPKWPFNQQDHSMYISMNTEAYMIQFMRETLRINPHLKEGP